MYRRSTSSHSDDDSEPLTGKDISSLKNVDPVSGKIVLACPDAETDMVQEERVSDKIFESLTPKAEDDSTYERMEESVSPEEAFVSFMKFVDSKDETDVIPKFS